MKFINYYYLLCYVSVLACYSKYHQFIIVFVSRIHNITYS